MRSKKLDNAIAVRLDPGDEIATCLKTACEKYRVDCAVISGLGTTKSAVIGVFNMKNKGFDGHEVDEFCEIANLTGNVTKQNGEIYLHLHATLGGESGRVYAGHLSTAVIGATAEIFIIPLGGEINHVYSSEIGTSLFDF